MKLSILKPKFEVQKMHCTLTFLCPRCLLTEIHLPVNEVQGDKTWKLDWTGFDTASVQPSIDFRHHNPKLKGECHAHFFITNGEIQML